MRRLRTILEEDRGSRRGRRSPVADRLRRSGIRLPRAVSARRCWILVVRPLRSRSASAPAGTGVSTRHVADANNNGVYVDAGPVTYQLQISRELNQYNVEDMQYLAGLPAATAPPTPDELWFGVFLWAKNQTERGPCDDRQVRHRRHHRATVLPDPLDPSVNPYAWTSQTLLPGGIEPRPEHARELRADSGSELSVQAQQLGLLEPAADASHRRTRHERRPADRSRSTRDGWADRRLGRWRGAGRRSARSLRPATPRPAPADRRCGRRATGARFGNSAPTTIRGWPTGRIADEPGVGVQLRVGGGALGLVEGSRCWQLRGARLARYSHAGDLRRRAGAELTTATIIRCTSPATWPLVTRTNFGGRGPEASGSGRRPPSRSSRHVGHLEWGRQHLPWPIAEEPTPSRCRGWPTGSSSPRRPGSSRSG